MHFNQKPPQREGEEGDSQSWHLSGGASFARWSHHHTRKRALEASPFLRRVNWGLKGGHWDWGDEWQASSPLGNREERKDEEDKKEEEEPQTLMNRSGFE